MKHKLVINIHKLVINVEWKLEIFGNCRLI